MSTVFISGYALMGTVLYGLLFFELFPAYDCLGVPCTPEDICNDGLAYQVNWDSKTSLHNWVEQLGLLCKPPAQIAALATAFMVT